MINNIYFIYCETYACNNFLLLNNLWLFGYYDVINVDFYKTNVFDDYM